MVEKDLLVVDKDIKDDIVNKLWDRISSQNLCKYPIVSTQIK